MWLTTSKWHATQRSSVLLEKAFNIIRCSTPSSLDECCIHWCKFQVNWTCSCWETVLPILSIHIEVMQHMSYHISSSQRPILVNDGSKEPPGDLLSVLLLIVTSERSSKARNAHGLILGLEMTCNAKIIRSSGESFQYYLVKYSVLTRWMLHPLMQVSGQLDV